MHAHSLLKHMPLLGTFSEVMKENQGPEPHREGAEPQPQLQESESELPPADSLEVLKQRDLADYAVQFRCFNRLSGLEDPSDGFNGSDYLNAQALLFGTMQE